MPRTLPARAQQRGRVEGCSSENSHRCACTCAMLVWPVESGKGRKKKRRGTERNRGREQYEAELAGLEASEGVSVVCCDRVCSAARH
eukprot:563593-Rhodomonas_salina.1